MNNPISRDLLLDLLPADVNPITFNSLPSTNSYLRDEAQAGAPLHTLVVAASQTEGRGRFNRAFFSPSDTGVYFSILLRPAHGNDVAAIITVAAALASCEACEAVFSTPAEIKWVNDVLIDGKKAVGILAEGFAGTDFFVILGIGANLVAPPGGFPPELQNAGSLTDTIFYGARERFVAETVKRLLGYLYHTGKKPLLDAYRSRVMMAGKTVTVTCGSERFEAVVSGIDDDARLIVARRDGRIEYLSYGEVTLHSENL